MGNSSHYFLHLFGACLDCIGLLLPWLSETTIYLRLDVVRSLGIHSFLRASWFTHNHSFVSSFYLVFKGQRCGNQNVFEAKSRVECCVGSHCVIAPTVTLLSSHPALVNISSSDEQLPLSSLPTTYLQDGSVAFHCRSNSSLNWTTTTTTVRCAGVKPYRESSSFGLHIRHIEYLKETLPKFHNLVVHSPIHS